MKRRLLRYIKNKEKVKIMMDVKKAVAYAKKIAAKNNLIVITGSIYTVGEALGRE